MILKFATGPGMILAPVSGSACPAIIVFHSCQRVIPRIETGARNCRLILIFLPVINRLGAQVFSKERLISADKYNTVLNKISTT
jgi:hypothetical protein